MNNKLDPVTASHACAGMHSADFALGNVQMAGKLGSTQVGLNKAWLLQQLKLWEVCELYHADVARTCRQMLEQANPL